MVTVVACDVLDLDDLYSTVILSLILTAVAMVATVRCCTPNRYLLSGVADPHSTVAVPSTILVHPTLHNGVVSRNLFAAILFC